MRAGSRRATDDEISAALLVLEQEGSDALTLDHVARRLGLSERGGAASLPWPSERWLRSDLAAHGFRRLGASMAEAISRLEAASDDPVERILASGRAYVRAAVRHPGLYSLMYQPRRVDFEHAELARDSAAAFDQLRSFVASLQAVGFQAHRDLDELARIVWDSVHRLAARWADAALDGAVDADTVDEAIDLELTLLLGDSPRRAARPPDAARAQASP